MKKIKGPVGYLQWQEALGQPLTVEHSLVLSRGGCKRKSEYTHVFNLISDYVTDNFNEYAKKLSYVSGVGVDDVYALREFSAKLRTILFYKKLKFITVADSRRLSDALIQAVNRTLDGLSEATDPDVTFEAGVIRRTLITEIQ